MRTSNAHIACEDCLSCKQSNKIDEICPMHSVISVLMNLRFLLILIRHVEREVHHPFLSSKCQAEHLTCPIFSGFADVRLLRCRLICFDGTHCVIWCDLKPPL